MATRIAFFVGENKPVEEKEFKFTYYTGFAVAQKQKSIISLHNEIKKTTDKQILEASSKSIEPLGKSLSAFNLTYRVDEKVYFLENIFQSSKVFESGGPYLELLDLPPIVAKKYEKLHTSGDLVRFSFNGVDYPLNPKTLFYDWMYCNALNQNDRIKKQVVKYNVFTDIEFNHEKSINCQARSCAIFVYLYKNNLLEKALSNIDNFKKIVYDENAISQETYSQISL